MLWLIKSALSNLGARDSIWRFTKVKTKSFETDVHIAHSEFSNFTHSKEKDIHLHCFARLTEEKSYDTIPKFESIFTHHSLNWIWKDRIG